MLSSGVWWSRVSCASPWGNPNRGARRHSTRMYHIRNSATPTFHPDISPPTFHPDKGARCHSTRMYHIRNSAAPPFHPDVSHLESSRRHSIRIFHRHHSTRMYHIRRLTPNGRGGRFNFPGQTYPDPLIALTRRVSQIFCTVPRCSPEASRYLPPTFWDIFPVPRCSPKASRYVRPTFWDILL